MKYKVYGLKNFDEYILKKKRRIIKIVEYINKRCEDVFDEIIILNHIINLYKKNNIIISKGEIKTVLRKYHNKNYHSFNSHIDSYFNTLSI